MYAPVRSFLESQGYVVRGEILNCDVVGVRDGHAVVVELKTSFCLEVVYQALERASYAHECFIAIGHSPAARRKGRFHTPTSSAENLCRRLGIGLLQIRDGQAYLLQKPTNGAGRPSLNSKRFGKLIAEFNGRTGDHNVGGSTGVERITAYLEATLRLLKLAEMSDDKTVTAAQGKKAGITKASSVLQQNFKGWFTRTGYGVYSLNADGEKALITYASIVKHFS